MPAALAGDHAQVWVGGYELTADTQRILISDLRDLHDVTTFGDVTHRFIPGQQMTRVDHMGYVDVGVGRSHEVLNGSAVDGMVSIALGQNAPPAVGDPMYSFHTRQNTYQTLPEAGKVVPFTARYMLGGDLAGAWGRALALGMTFNNTTTSAVLNHGGPTGGGGMAVLHVIQNAASDTYAISVEGATNSAFTTGVVTLATFPLNASALGTARVPISGTIPQYLRWRATRTGSAGNPVRIIINIIRY